MLLLYFKLVPGAVMVKLINNIAGSFIPTLNIIFTASFLDAAVAAVGDRSRLSGVFFPLGAIIAVLLYNYYVEIIISLINTYAGNKIKIKTAPAISGMKAGIKFKYHENQDSVDIMNRALGNFEANLQGFFDQVFGVWNITAQLAGFIVILGTQLWWAPVVFTATCVPSFIISYRFGKKKYDAEKETTKNDRKAAYLTATLTGRDTIEERYVYGYTDKLNEMYKDKYEYARLARKKVERKRQINTKGAGMLVFISGIIVIAILIPSAIFPEANGQIKLSVGMFTALLNAVFGLSQQMQWSISAYISDFKYKLEYLLDLNKVIEFEKEDDAVCAPCVNVPELKTIEFKNVSFAYPGTDKCILNNFSVKMVSGKHYAIVGVNGAGKTTLTKLITGLYKEYTGEISVNGKNLREYTEAELKALTAVVYQDFCRYPMDFYHNIAIGNVNDMQNRGKTENAAELIGLAEVAGKLPKKYETPVTKIKEGGVDLSGGEWQRIALARLIVNPAPLKILDEPTAALDPVSESRVYNHFNEIVSYNKKSKSNTITVFISHRLGSTRLADEIIVLSEGRAAEAGTFDELISENGLFAEMFSSQAQWYSEKEESSLA